LRSTAAAAGAKSPPESSLAAAPARNTVGATVVIVNDHPTFR
jgi:hypothetical protein